MKKLNDQGKQNAQYDSEKLRIRYEKQIQKIKNEMDLVEILCNFWPLPNMTAKHRRLRSQLQEVNRALKDLNDPPRETVIESSQMQSSEPFVVLHSSPFTRRALIH